MMMPDDIAQNVVCALFLATVYWKQASIIAHADLLYFSTQYFAFSSIRQVCRLGHRVMVV